MVGTSGVNGDVFFIFSDNTTIMLSDGASGAGKEGKVVMSRQCAKTIEENPFIESGLSSKEYLDKVIWKINNDLIEISQRSKTYTFGTLVICVIQNNIATIASIGDSPAYLIHKNNVKRVAKTTKTYQNLIDMGVLTEEQAEEYVRKLHGYMHSMFDRFIPMVVPVYSLEEVELTSRDMVVLCCDGISDYVKPEEIAKNIKSDNLTDSVNLIIDIAKNRSIEENKRKQYDDITMVVYCH
jgi:serine/threonine protein phosphatase PrpC